jgi:ring-1,2-phenylacetyl-CoA epoxidase subunit PaaC
MMQDEATSEQQSVQVAPELPDDVRGALAGFAIGLGDDALVLGHRLSEWCGVGPTLEEDIALSNIALDLIGRADGFLTIAGQLEGDGRSADDLAFLRDATHYRNAALVELPKGDFAFTMVRQFLFDAFVLPLSEWIAANPGPLAGVAAKAVKESRYHVRHSSEWVRRLGGGTDASHMRAQAAVDELWMYTEELFDFGPEAVLLVEARHAPPPDSIRTQWNATIEGVLGEAGLVIPEVKYHFSGARIGRHTEYLGHMLSEMQILPRSHPGAEW